MENASSENDLPQPPPITKLAFYGGSFLAFLSGLITTVDNFLIKETKSDFGELLAFRSLLQMSVATSIALAKGWTNLILNNL